MYTVPLPNSTIPGEWSSGIFSCCEDFDGCCYGFCCPSCVLIESHNQLSFIPVEDIDKCCGCVQSLGSLYWVGLLFTGFSNYQTRKMVMNTFTIKEEYTCLKAYCCFWCSACQIDREMKFRKKNQPPPPTGYRMA